MEVDVASPRRAVEALALEIRMLARARGLPAPKIRISSRAPAKRRKVGPQNGTVRSGGASAKDPEAGQAGHLTIESKSASAA